MPEGGSDWLTSTLRNLREGAGLSGSEAARRIEISQPRMSRIEGGKFVPTDGEIRALCKLYRAPPETRRALLQAAGDLRAETIPARVVMSHGTWQMQARVSRIEKRSAEVCVWQPALIPGLLQTAEYAGLVFSDGGDIPAEDVARSVAERMKRGNALAEDKAFTFVVAEGALRWQAGSPQIMLGQLAHITDVIGQRDNVRFGVIPQAQAVDVFTTHGFSLYDRRTVIVGIRTGTSFISDPRDLAEYSKLFSHLEALAVFGQSAVAVIDRVAREYRALS